MKHFTITLEPEGRQISIHSGATLVEAAGQAGIILNTVCGGRGTCKKCIAYLEPEGRKVLACNYRIQSDLVVTIPRDSRFFEQQILTEGAEAEPGIEPDIYKAYSHAAAGGAILGVAVDVGTTTVVARLVDMTSGQCLATEAALNPQTRFGDDVISRIAYAETDEKLAELHEAITGCINDLISKLCEKAGVQTDSIFEICVVGNTTMNHIFLKLPVAQLGQAPYRAYCLDACDLTAGDSALGLNAAGNVHTVENIAGFVGSDTTAVALAAGIDTAEEMTLAVDIGTNGEIVLGTRNKLYAASCAAGPAFEGARISCGSRAAEGAIEAVVLGEDDIDLDVIGNCPPRSICGSGLIDAVAVMLYLGIVETTGRFADPETLRGKLPPAIFSRLRRQDGQPAFCLAENGDAGTVLPPGTVVVTGGGRIRKPIIESVKFLDLSEITLTDLKVADMPNIDGVLVTVEAVANIRFRDDAESLLAAGGRFLDKSHTDIERTARETLEANLRGVVGRLTVEEIIQDREAFRQKVLEEAGEDLARLGMQIDVFNPQSITDSMQYIMALGKKRTAEVHRDARIGEAEAQSEAKKKASDAERAAEVVAQENERQMAEARKNADVAKQQYAAEVSNRCWPPPGPGRRL